MELEKEITKNTKCWLHRISHCFNVSSILLEKGILTIEFSDFLKDEKFFKKLEDKNFFIDEKWNFFESENIKIWGDLYRNRYSLWRFLLEFSIGDIVLVPLPGKFSIYKIVSPPKLIKDLPIDQINNEMCISNNFLMYNQEKIDLGYFIEVRPLTSQHLNIPRDLYADNSLSSRMKIRLTNANITDLRENIKNIVLSVSEQKPINFYTEASNTMAIALLQVIRDKLNDSKFENLIKWYFEKLGASNVYVLSKNKSDKEDGADADVEATFLDLKIKFFIQAKLHVGKESTWAVEQIKKYHEQFKNNEDDFQYIPWVISTADIYDNEAIEIAKENQVRLIDGIEFAKMLINVGIKNINNAF